MSEAREERAGPACGSVRRKPSPPGDPRPVVNENSCTECYGFFGESQCVVVCPVGAVVGVPEEVRQLEVRFQSLYPGRVMQDTWVWRRLPTEGLP